MPTSLLVAHYLKDLAPSRLVEILMGQEMNVKAGDLFLTMPRNLHAGTNQSRQ
jgi:hypothetical protein